MILELRIIVEEVIAGLVMASFCVEIISGEGSGVEDSDSNLIFLNLTCVGI